MIYGYARISTLGQTLDTQLAQLKTAGIDRLVSEKVSGVKQRRELEKLLDRLEPGDVLVVTKLDRLARSTLDLLQIVARIGQQGAGFRSLGDSWADTTTPHGRLMMTILAGIAEFERELIHQRTRSGRVAAKARGVRFGRPPKLTADQIALGQRLVGEGTSVREAAKLLKCHHATLYRALSAPAVTFQSRLQQ